jgi:hypothetical protein
MNTRVEFGHFLPGGQRLPAGIKGVNETYRGWIEVDSVRLQAYVKFLHPWEIFNEALGSILCQLVGLPTPRSFLVVVDRNDYPSSAVFLQTQSTKALAFASLAMTAQALSRHVSVKALPALRLLVEEWLEWPDVLLFDQWIANPDRHTGNVLIGAPGEFYLIDHGLCFYRRNWMPEQILAAVPLVTARLWTDFLQNTVSLQKRIDAQQRIYAASAKQLDVDLTSAAVLTKAHQLIPPGNLAALVSFLEMRRTAAAQVTCSVIGVPGLPFGETK